MEIHCTLLVLLYDTGVAGSLIKSLSNFLSEPQSKLCSDTPCENLGFSVQASLRAQF